MRKKRFFAIMITLCLAAGLAACGNMAADNGDKTKELYVLAAASMTDALQQIGKEYQKNHEQIELVYQFDSSGTLKTQIEEGAPADVFISAGTKQMKELKENDLIEADSDFPLLKNKVVLIVPKESYVVIDSFEDAAADKVSMIAIGNADVPVGAYTETIYKNLGLWEKVQGKANHAANVRQVLDWVAAGNVQCGIVYATDAQSEEKVEVVCEAPKDSCESVIYPAGMVSASEQKEAAAEFLEFLQTEEVFEILENYGFTPL